MLTPDIKVVSPKQLVVKLEDCRSLETISSILVKDENKFDKIDKQIEDK